MTEEVLRDFFTAYGVALAAGDLASIAGAYTLPALILSDAGSIPVSSDDQIAAAAHAAAAHYRDQGIVSIQPRLTRVDPISATLVSADITWLYQDDAGGTVLTEAYRYLLRAESPSAPRIQVAMRRAD